MLQLLKSRFVAVVSMVGLRGLCAPAMAQTYTVTDLGTLGGSYSHASGINNSGQVVGRADLSNYDPHAFLWSGGAMQDLGTLGGSGKHASGINDSGQVVGRAHLSNGDYHACLWPTIAAADEVFEWRTGSANNVETLFKLKMENSE